MQPFIDSIEKSLETENWYAAIAVALTLPDICARLEDPAKRGGRGKFYIEWFDRYLKNEYEMTLHGAATVFLSGQQCYALRCAYLHAGIDDISNGQVQDTLSKIHFSTMGSHKGKLNETQLLLDVKTFCRDIAAAAKQWLAENADNEGVQQRMTETVTIRDIGFQPIPGVYVGPREATLPPFFDVSQRRSLTPPKDPS